MQGIREEQLLAADLVIGNGALPWRSDQPVNEGLSFLRFDMRVLCRIDQDHPVLIEQPPIAFHQVVNASGPVKLP